MFEADVRDPVQGQLKLRSSHLGELWFCPKEEYHTYRLRTSTEKDPFWRVSVKLLVGSNECLNEHGKMPELENAGIAVIVPPDEDELQDPPGEGTTPELLAGDVPEMLVHYVYVWLRRGTLWARFYLDANDMGLIAVDDPVGCPVSEIRDKYVIVHGVRWG